MLLLVPVVRIGLRRRLQLEHKRFAGAVELVVHLPRVGGEDSKDVVLHVLDHQDRRARAGHAPVECLQGDPVPASRVQQVPLVLGKPVRHALDKKDNMLWQQQRGLGHNLGAQVPLERVPHPRHPTEGSLLLPAVCCRLEGDRRRGGRPAGRRDGRPLLYEVSKVREGLKGREDRDPAQVSGAHALLPQDLPEYFLLGQAVVGPCAIGLLPRTEQAVEESLALL